MKEEIKRKVSRCIVLVVALLILTGFYVSAYAEEVVVTENEITMDTVEADRERSPETVASDVNATLQTLEAVNNDEKIMVAAKPVKEKERAKIVLSQFYWRESNTDRLDYTMNFTVLTYKSFRFRYDILDFDAPNIDSLSRYWFYAGQFPVVNTADAKIILWPGVHWDQKSNTFYGGDIIMQFPRVGLSIVQRSFGGEHKDKHYTFADFKVGKSGDFDGYFSYYLLARGAASPDAYLGPKITIAKNFSIWYGLGVARAGSSLLNLSATVKF